MVADKEERSGFASSPFKHRKEQLKAEYLKNFMKRTDMDDFLILSNREMFRPQQYSWIFAVVPQLE